MKKNVLRVLAIMMAISVLVMAFAACGPKDSDTDESSSNVSGEASTDDVSNTGDTTTDTTKPGDTTDTTKQGDTAKPGANPTDKAGAVAAFNSAGLKATAGTRKMTAGSLSADLLPEPINLLTDENIKPRVEQHFDTTAASSAAALPKLQEGQIQNFTASADGFTITLKNASATANGENGYATVVDLAQAKTLIGKVSSGIEVMKNITLKDNSVTVNTFTTNMSNGKYVVKMSSGKVTSIEYSAIQDSTLTAKVKVSVFSADAKGAITATLSATYA